MPQVYRINKEERVSVFLTDAIWAKIKKRPNVFGKYKWELVPIPKSPIYKDDLTKKPSPIYKSSLVGDDLAKPPKGKPIKYTEEKYREDLKSAKLLLNAGNKKDALFMYQQAFIFKESPYVKKQIKLLS